MFFRGEHKYHKDELGCEEHLNEETLDYACSTTESCVDVHRAGKEDVDYARGAQRGYNLSEEDGDGAEGFDGSDEVESECDLCSV